MTTPGPDFTSTVPGAIALLNQKFQTISQTNLDLDLGYYIGPPLNSVKNNFLAIGNPTGEGDILSNYVADYQGMRQTATLRMTESYGLHCWMRTLANGVDQIGRFTDAMRLINAVTSALAGDLNGSGQLSPSGEWHLGEFQNTINGPVGNVGWGCLFEFTVEVRNVILTAA